jgi:hypothetical protein
MTPETRQMLALHALDRPYLFFVAPANQADARWSAVTEFGPTFVNLENGQTVAFDEILYHLVQYENNELMFTNASKVPPPENMEGLVQPPNRHYEVSKPELEAGRALVIVEHLRSAVAADNRTYFQTELTNLHSQRVRVTGFGALTKTRETATSLHFNGGLFSEGQFRAWYGLGGRFWLESGETVNDPMNWSSSGIDWLYFFEDEYRKRHVTGCPT